MRHMAVLRTQANGNAAVAVLDETDRSLLEAAIQAYTTSNHVSVSKLAQTIGVGRTYFYNLIKSNSIELSRLEQLQRVLDISILEDSQISTYLRKEESRLSGRSEGFYWASKCMPIEVDGFYLVQYLLPSIESESRFFASLDELCPSSNVYEINPYEPDAYLLGKTCEFIRHGILGLNSSLKDEIFCGFYENEDEKVFTIPIATNSGVWGDIEDVIDEKIYSDHTSDEQEVYFEAFDEVDLCRDSLQKLLRVKCDQYDLSLRDDLKNHQLGKEIEYLQTWLDRERVQKSHDDFKKKIEIIISNINEFSEVILDFCRTNDRQPRRKSYYPLELEELASNLELGTIQKVPQPSK